MANMPPETGSGTSSILNEQGLIVGKGAPLAFIPTVPVPPPVPEFTEEEPDPCAAKLDNEIEINQEDELVIATKRIKEITQQIKSVTDCNSLKLIVKQHLDDIKKEATKAVEEQLELLKKYLPFTSLPSPTPTGIVKWLAKLVTGTIIPQLEAFIKYTTSILALILALNDIIQAIQKALPRLKACAKQIYRETKENLKNEIDQEVKKLEKKISRDIANYICEAVPSGIQAAGDAITAYRLVEDTLEAANQLKTTLKIDAENSLTQIEQCQTQMQSITGIPPAIATNTLDNFQASIDSGAFDTYKAQNQAFVDALPPVNDVPPVASGIAAVGNTVTCNTGVWTSNSAMTYSAQWYREGSSIYNANTFTYSPTIDDIEYNLYCLVTGENKAGSIEVKSNEVGPVVYSVPAGNEPIISGTLLVGSRLYCTDGIWTGFVPTKYDYQWFSGSNMVSSANSSYLIASGDVGQQIKCKVIASSTRYTLAVDSDPVTIPNPPPT
jgi:hypothetical protein